MTKKNKIIIAINILVLLLFVIMFVPYEQWIFRFETPEKALKFDYTAEVKKIMSTIELEQVSYISYLNKENTITGKYLEKDKRGWIPPIKKIIISNKVKTKFEYTMISYIEKNKNIMLITNRSSNKDAIIKSITDSIGTEFKNSSYEYSGVYYTDWIGIIKEYPKEYKLYLDDEIIEL